MARLPCDECGKMTNHYGSWDTPIKILCKDCIDKRKLNLVEVTKEEHEERCIPVYPSLKDYYENDKG